MDNKEPLEIRQDDNSALWKMEVDMAEQREIGEYLAFRFVLDQIDKLLPPAPLIKRSDYESKHSDMLKLRSMVLKMLEFHTMKIRGGTKWT